MAWLSLTELDTAVVLGSDWLVSVIVVSVCLPSDALSQHLPSYLAFSCLERGVSLTAAPPDLEHGVAPLGPPVPRY